MTINQVISSTYKLYAKVAVRIPLITILLHQI